MGEVRVGVLGGPQVQHEGAQLAFPTRKALALFVYLSSGARVHTPRELDGWLRDAGFGPPRKIRVLRLPGLSLRVATKSGSA